MRHDEASGGCQCRRIRYRAGISEADAYLCHCTMCRHATGGASIAFVGLPLGAVEWQTEPDWYRSSPIAERAFCSSCGTPLGFRFVDAPIQIDITLGSFDDPGRFVPTHGYAAESILPAWLDGSHLPCIRSEENSHVAERWIRAVGKLPD